jgi:EF-P beta-lysylation protein EpmB
MFKVFGSDVKDSKERSSSIKGNAGSPAWRDILKIKDLLSFLELDRDSAPYKIIENSEFRFLVPMSFAQRMRKGDWNDPLLLQVVPRGEESVEKEGFTDDAVGDAAAQVAPALLHKYASRMLLAASSSCAMHCRFCFRRHYAFCTDPSWGNAVDSALHYVTQNLEINEVILSGGDPLCLDPEGFGYYARRIIAVPHVKTVRFHTRLPIADPGRVTQPILDAITSIASVKNCIIVLHANHSKELAGECSQLLTHLRATGALLLNQSVLLRGINDSVEALCDLSRALLDHGILPYYLHQLDRVRGTWHFEVEEERGKRLMRGLREKLPGYAVPRYVREVTGEKSKISIH